MTAVPGLLNHYNYHRKEYPGKALSLPFLVSNNPHCKTEYVNLITAIGIRAWLIFKMPNFFLILENPEATN
jgi:hypothetical protein